MNRAGIAPAYRLSYRLLADLDALQPCYRVSLSTPPNQNTVSPAVKHFRFVSTLSTSAVLAQ
jgi:hypothetical protein